MSETNLYSENLLDCHVRRSIVHSSPAKTSPKSQIIFSTIFFCIYSFYQVLSNFLHYLSRRRYHAEAMYSVCRSGSGAALQSGVPAGRGELRAGGGRRWGHPADPAAAEHGPCHPAPAAAGYERLRRLHRSAAAVRCAGAVPTGEGGRERQDPVLLRGRG